MRSVIKLTLVLALAVLTAPIAGAECVSTIIPVSIRGANPNRAASATAWTGTILGATKVERSSQNAIYFATYSEELVELTSDRRVADSSENGPLALLWNGFEFGLFYLNSAAQWTLQRISASGDVIGTPIAVAAQHPPAREREYDIVWDPSRQAYVAVFTVTTGVNRGIYVSVISREGAELATHYLSTIVATPTRPQVAVTNDSTIGVAFHVPGTDAVRFVTLDRSMQVIVATVSLAAAREIELSTDGTNFVVVGTNRVTPTEIRWMTMSRTGAAVSSDAPLVNTQSEIAPAQLHWNADLQEWALFYIDSFYRSDFSPGQLRMRRLTPAGDRLSDTPFSPDLLTSTYSGIVPVWWSGKSYLGSIALDQATQTDSFVARHCPLGVTPTSDRRFVRAGEVITFTAVPSGGTPQYSYFWSLGDSAVTEIGPSLTYRYQRNGTYTVTVTVVDAAGGTSKGTMTVEVRTGKRRAAR